MGPCRLPARTTAQHPGRREARSRAERRLASPGGSSRRSGAEGRGGAMKGPGCGSSASPVIREGELEKRSASLLQLWKKKAAVLSADSLRLFEGGKAKELRFGAIQKVDCVERTGKYVYFTIVTTDRREIDFRCPGESCWNASITMALIDFQNKRALQRFRSRRGGHDPHPLDGAPRRHSRDAPPPRNEDHISGC